MDTILTSCKSKPGQSRPFSMTYLFEGQSIADIDTKFAINMSPTREKNEQWTKYRCPESTAKNSTVQCMNCKLSGKVWAFLSSG